MAATARLLIVEDERAQREGLVRYLVKQGYEVDSASSAEDAMTLLEEQDHDLMITDLRLPKADGLALVRHARERNEELSVLLVTAYASVESVIEALRVGAHDYLLKPLILEDVGRKVNNLLKHRALLLENARLRHALSREQKHADVITESPAMQESLAWMRRAAAARSTVLITGETGTGKEVMARAIHKMSAEADKPFAAVNLAAIPDTLLESELFGHERAAFTGADRRREGIFRSAHGGTVLLDEIGELPLPIQVKLLRAIETCEVQPLGSDRSVKFDARIIAATHRDLKEMVEQGTFRQDLYYRLNVLRIHMPPLRERREDIPSLVHRLLERHAENSKLAEPIVTAQAMRALVEHSWKGNVRELSNILERALILAEEGRIDVEQLPADVHMGTEGESSLNLQEAVARFERDHIASVLRLCSGNRERAAELLGISPATLYRRLERLQLKGYEVRRNPTDAPLS